jgi:cobalt transporter subunit CbtA
MIQRMVTSACVAGIAAGLLAALLHYAFVQKYILLGETYESGAAVHFDGVLAGGHDHEAGSQEHDHAAHDHGAAGETSPLQRNGMTVLFFALLYAAYGLIMVAGFGLAQHFGQRISAREGVLWGIAGFVAIQLAPAIGLAPELPGTVGPDLTDRQVWWALAVLLLALPHLIGAPELDGFTGVAPPEVASAFAARSLAVGLVAWSLMGWLAGWMWDRDAVR